MNYQRYYSIDVLNGPGTRCTLFVSGCEHACKGCYNQSTWSLSGGQPVDDNLIRTILNDLSDNRINRQGLSLTGGDPLHPQNCATILGLVKLVKDLVPEKDIWLWTGYQLHELSFEQRQILPYINVLIDGKFEQSLYDANLLFRGSSNQVIYTNPWDHFNQKIDVSSQIE
ncbi:anaerobic ribonucleoside-triphosphate reductase-activating protein [Thorsellia anophelis]|uniref:anaerobic ribonucleoside-triphosphate reductase-activating protein n=1 Tax=Thorsellia anophelis TaxID=336804 RepID=UPI000B89A8A6|nr:anaerobic ribonucleoside-triphosphate reductase-activating protein [Thorsellia anophelis]